MSPISTGEALGSDQNLPFNPQATYSYFWQAAEYFYKLSRQTSIRASKQRQATNLVFQSTHSFVSSKLSLHSRRVE